MAGTMAKSEGIINPPIDELLEHADSRYALVVLSVVRARQINAYSQQSEVGLLDTIGPLVDYTPYGKTLFVVIHEVS